MSRPLPARTAFILLLLAAIGPAVAQPAATNPEPEVITLTPTDTAVAPEGEAAPRLPVSAQGINAREILSDLWFRYQALRQQGAAREAATLIDAAVGFMRREGLQSAPEIAAAFLADGRRALRDGDSARAAEAFRQAARFDPALASARFALAGSLLLREHDPAGAFRAWRDGVVSLFTDPAALFHLSGRVLLALYLGLSWGAALALSLIVLRTSPALFHDLKERMRGGAGVTLAPLFGSILLFGPLLLPVPLTWVLVFWAALVFASVRRAEKAVILTALLVLLLAGPFGSVIAWHFETANDDVARALRQSARSGADLRQEAALRRAARESPGDPVYLSLLASALRVGGRFDEAMAIYKQVLEIDPGNARALINLGNLHALRQEFAQAQALYQKAADADPSLALSHYNSHLAHLETFNMEAADEELRRARAADDPLVTRLIHQAGDPSSKRAPQDALHPAGDIWKRALRLKFERIPAREAARAIASPTTLAAGAALLAALLLPGLAIVPRSGGAHLCRRCGQPYCRRCQVITKFPETCSPCVHLFILKDGLAPAVRDRKKVEVVRHRQRTFLMTRVVSLILPGCGHVLSGRPVFGLLLLCAWCAAFFGLLLRSLILPSTGGPMTPPVSGGLLLLIALALATWLAANLSRQERAAD